MLDELKASTKRELKIENCGLMKNFLGIELKKSSQHIFRCQQKYVIDILNRFTMDK